MIGAGGVAQQVAQALLLHMEYAMGAPKLTVFDGDKFEGNNAPRQFLARDPDNVGRNKAEMFRNHFAPIYGGVLEHVPHYFYHGLAVSHLKGQEVDGIVVVADNHAARMAGLAVARDLGCPLVSGANETSSGEAWCWRPEVDGTAADPFVRYPEIELAGDRDNPLSASGCSTDEDYAAEPQTPRANALTAACLLHVAAGNLCNPMWDMFDVAETRFTGNSMTATTFHGFLNP